MMLIGISGVAGSGKSTAGDFITEAFDAIAIGQADPMKVIAAMVFGFTDHQLYGPSEARNAEDLRYPRPDAVRFDWCKVDHQHGPECGDPIYLTPRHALQALGTWGRDCYVDVWAKAAVRRAERLLLDGHDVVTGRTHSRKPSIVMITDVRYPNELSTIRSAGGRVIRVLRPGSGLAGAAGDHSSEQAMRDVPDAAFDAVVHNDASISDFRTRVLDAVTALSWSQDAA